VKTIQCATHGLGELVFVCDHLLQTSHDGVARGAYIFFDAEKTMSAWCKECDDRATASEGQPDREPLKFDVKTLCRTCFEPIRRLNGGGILYR
jgi:hypothetical protein